MIPLGASAVRCWGLKPPIQESELWTSVVSVDGGCGGGKTGGGVCGLEEADDDKEGDNGGVGPCGPAEGGLWAKYLLASRGHRCGMASMRGVLQCTGAAWTQWVGPCLSSWVGGTAAPGFPSIGAPTACVEGAM